MPHRISGIKKPTSACSKPTLPVICCKYCSTVCGVMAAVTSSLLLMPDHTPTSSGVPTAPNDTGVDWIIKIDITEAMAGKPSASKSGAPTAEGVPKPEEPSTNEPNSHATIITCTRRSGDTSIKPWRIE